MLTRRTRKPPTSSPKEQNEENVNQNGRYSGMVHVGSSHAIPRGWEWPGNEARWLCSMLYLSCEYVGHGEVADNQSRRILSEG